ncbi:hypothetical protein [Streptomyces sp. NPDC001658]
MTTAPIAQTIHPGGSIPDPDRQDVLGPWLRANGINPRSVAAVEPITVLPVPHEADGGNWMIQVIVFSQFHELPDGTHDQNLITRQPVKFQRTVPLRVPFPTDPAPKEKGEEERDADEAEEGEPEAEPEPSGDDE